MYFPPEGNCQLCSKCDFETDGARVEYTSWEKEEPCNWKCYLDRYPDLQQLVGAYDTGAAEQHYHASGKQEGRDCRCQIAVNQGGRECEMAHDQQWFGIAGDSDISQVAANSAEECRDWCTNSLGCEYFVFTPEAHKCWLKNNFRGSRASLSAFQPVGPLGSHGSSEGTDVGTITYTTIADCDAACRANPACKHYTACPGDGNQCVLKTGESKVVDVLDAGRDCRMYFPPETTYISGTRCANGFALITSGSCKEHGLFQLEGPDHCLKGATWTLEASSWGGLYGDPDCDLGWSNGVDYGDCNGPSDTYPAGCSVSHDGTSYQTFSNTAESPAECSPEYMCVCQSVNPNLGTSVDVRQQVGEWRVCAQEDELCGCAGTAVYGNDVDFCTTGTSGWAQASPSGELSFDFVTSSRVHLSGLAVGRVGTQQKGFAGEHVEQSYFLQSVPVVENRSSNLSN